MRKGITTGVCGAAAARAATRMLIKQASIRTIGVHLPSGRSETCKLFEPKFSEEEASCGVIKTPGNSPNTSDGIMIYAHAMGNESSEVALIAGEGIGTVTKPGLSVPVGQAAIFPEAGQLIRDNIKSEISDGRGVTVTIFTPEGEARAQRSRISRLGILGGISISGTAMSSHSKADDSLQEFFIPQIDIALAQGYTTLALVPGMRGEKAARQLGFEADAVLQTSNHIGEMLDYCATKSIERVLLLGHVGTLAKIAGGYFDMRSTAADDPIEIMKQVVRKHTKDMAPIALLSKVNTAEDGAKGLIALGYGRLLDMLSNEILSKVNERTKSKLMAGVALTIHSGDICGIDRNAQNIIRSI